MPQDPTENRGAVVATRHTVQIPTRLAGLLVALFLLVPVGSAFIAGRGSAAPTQTIVYQLPAVTAAGQLPGAPYSAPKTTPPGGGGSAVTMASPAMPPASPTAAPTFGPIEELQKLISNLHPDNLIPNIMKALAKTITGIDPNTNQPVEGRPDVASQIGAWLLQTPNFASPAFAGTQPIRDFIDTLRAVGWAILLVTAAAAAIRFKLGMDSEPAGTVVRLLVCALLLGFYHELFSWGVSASNEITAGIFDIQQAGWGGLGRFTVAGFVPLQAVLMVVAFFVLLVVGFVRVLSLVLFLVVYALGPIVVPMRMLPEWDFFGRWWQTGIRALVWPVLWAVEAKLILLLTTTAWAGGIAGVLFAPLAQLALLYAMYKTPSWVAVAGNAASPKIVRTITNLQTVGRITYTTAAAASSGGLAMAARAALTGLPAAARQAAASPKPERS